MNEDTMILTSARAIAFAGLPPADEDAYRLAIATAAVAHALHANGGTSDLPVGIKEIAKLLGLAPTTVALLRYQRELPEADGEGEYGVSGHPWWWSSTIFRWAHDTGRLPRRGAGYTRSKAG